MKFQKQLYFAMKIFKKYKDKTMTVVQNNPYKLADDFCLMWDAEKAEITGRLYLPDGSEHPAG